MVVMVVISKEKVSLFEYRARLQSDLEQKKTGGKSRTRKPFKIELVKKQHLMSIAGAIF